MEWWMLILAFAVAGLIVGGLARLVLPGPETIGILGTILAGLGGSVVGGFIGNLLFGRTGFWVSLLFAVGGAVLLILPFRAYRSRVNY